jgi:two-component system chemotaxis response regulator CheY
MKVLIVEDDLASQKLIAVYLRGASVIELADDGEAALTMFETALNSNQRFDLVLLDIMLPKRNGQEVLEGLRKLEFAKGIGGLDGVKVIMLTALRDAQTIMKSFRLQAEAYLPKPIIKEKLLKEIQSLGLTLSPPS